MSFKQSDKVVCVDDADQDPACLAPVRKGVVYVVREAFEGVHWRTDERTAGVKLVGMFPFASGTGDVGGGYCAHRFRLLSEVQAENRERQKTEAMIQLLRLVDDATINMDEMRKRIEGP